MKAVIVPGVTDMNKGDQALVWESHRIAMDTGLFEKVYLLTTGDTPEERQKLCSQSELRGFSFIENVLKHPRRGRHKSQDTVFDSSSSLVKLTVFAVIDFISRSFLLITCNSPKVLRFFYNKKTQKSIEQLRTCDTFFVKGGGFIHAYGERTAPYLIWFFLFYVRLAYALNKKVVFLPNSFGPFEGISVKRQVKNIFSKLDLIYAREELSAMKLGELMRQKICVSPDLGFYLRKNNNFNSIDLLKKYDLTVDDKLVGVTIRPWRFPGSNDSDQLYENYLTAVTSLIQRLILSRYKVILCNQSIGPNTHEDDRNAIKAILNKIKNDNLIWINEDLSCDDLKALYSNFYAFIGTRFHSVIFSLTSLIPSIAIAYGGNKAKGIMTDFDMEKYAIGIDEVSGDILNNLFSELEKNHINIKDQLLPKIQMLDKKRGEIIKEIRKVHLT